LKVLVVTGRTIDQGCGKESGKLSEEYMGNVALCEINPEDMDKLKIRDGGNVKVTTRYGSVVVRAKKSRRTRTPSTVFIPYGPWTNTVFASATNATGMPLLKGVEADIEATDEKILTLHELLNQSYSK